MLISCSNSESGCWIFLRRATCVGCSAATQKRSVATVCFRRERSSRYSATSTPETEASSAANWPKVRFKKNIVAHAVARGVARLLATPFSYYQAHDSHTVSKSRAGVEMSLDTARRSACATSATNLAPHGSCSFLIDSEEPGDIRRSESSLGFATQDPFRWSHAKAP